MTYKNESHIRFYGSGVYYLDSNGVLWHNSISTDKKIRFLFSILHIKFVSKFRIIIK